MDENTPSKSQRKRDAHELQTLGESLLELSESELAKLPLPDILRTALADTKRIHTHGARRRQLQYVGKLMRGIDCSEIEAALLLQQQNLTHQTEAFHQLETWRDRLIADGDTALQAITEQYPQIDRQHVRQLVRNALQQQKNHKPPQASRALFRYLREVLQSTVESD